jgi:hypothetical protein
MSNVARIICADWGKKPEKRAAYEVLIADRLVRRVAANVHEVHTLLHYAAQGNLSTLVAFDAPIGVPKSFVTEVQKRPAGANVKGFMDWLLLAPFDHCDDAARWSPDAPFFQVPPDGGDGSLDAFVSAAQRQGVDLYRRIERQTGGKTVFLTAGVPGSVGSAARDIWKGLATVRKQKTPFRVWPFEGPPEVMVAVNGPVVAEIYPRAAYATALVDAAPRARLFVAKADKKKVPKELRADTRVRAIERLLSTRWTETAGVKFEDIDHARENEDDFDALMTAAALLRCVIEELPLSSSAYHDPLSEGAILGSGSIDLTLPEVNFSTLVGATSREGSIAVGGASRVPTVRQTPSSARKSAIAVATVTKGIGCYCGCGGAAKSFFAQGHDGRLKGWLLRKHGLSMEQIAARPLADLAVEYGYGPVPPAE